MPSTEKVARMVRITLGALRLTLPMEPPIVTLSPVIARKARNDSSSAISQGSGDAS